MVWNSEFVGYNGAKLFLVPVIVVYALFVKVLMLILVEGVRSVTFNFFELVNATGFVYVLRIALAARVRLLLAILEFNYI